MLKFPFWQKWLLAVSIIMLGFGILLALLNGTFLFDWMNNGINPPFWQDAGLITPAIHAYQQWTIGLLGTVMACWGLTVAFIAHYPFRRLENWAWFCVALGVGLWFVMDESLSLFYRVYFNALFNLVFLAMLVLPLAFSRRHFTTQARRK